MTVSVDKPVDSLPDPRPETPEALFPVTVGDIRRPSRLDTMLAGVRRRMTERRPALGDRAAIALVLRHLGAFVGGGDAVHTVADWWEQDDVVVGVTLCGIHRRLEPAWTAGPACLRCRYIAGGGRD